MELENVTWRGLKSIYLTLEPIKKLVDSWVDCGSEDVERFITSYNNRHFLRRLVNRAYLELDDARLVHHLELDKLAPLSGWSGERLISLKRFDSNEIMVFWPLKNVRLVRTSDLIPDHSESIKSRELSPKVME